MFLYPQLRYFKIILSLLFFLLATLFTLISFETYFKKLMRGEKNISTDHSLTDYSHCYVRLIIFVINYVINLIYFNENSKKKSISMIPVIPRLELPNKNSRSVIHSKGIITIRIKLPISPRKHAQLTIPD